MENNQKNIQNEINNYEKNINERETEKSVKRKTIALIVIVLVLILVTSICVVYLLIIKNNKNTVNVNKNPIEQSKDNKDNLYLESQQNVTNKFDLMQLKNCIYENEKINGQRYYRVSVDESGTPTIYMETIGREMTTIILDKESYNYVSQEVAAGTVYVTFQYDGVPGSGEIKYSNVSDNESIYVKLDGNSDYMELKKVK